MSGRVPGADAEGGCRRTLKDDTEGALAYFLAHPVVDADDVLRRASAAVGVCGHLAADGEGGEGREGEGEKKRE
jgi:hypothetical protein